MSRDSKHWYNAEDEKSEKGRQENQGTEYNAKYRSNNNE